MKHYKFGTPCYGTMALYSPAPQLLVLLVSFSICIACNRRILGHITPGTWRVIVRIVGRYTSVALLCECSTPPLQLPLPLDVLWKSGSLTFWKRIIDRSSASRMDSVTQKPPPHLSQQSRILLFMGVQWCVLFYPQTALQSRLHLKIPRVLLPVHLQRF